MGTVERLVLVGARVGSICGHHYLPRGPGRLPDAVGHTLDTPLKPHPTLPGEPVHHAIGMKSSRTGP